MSTMAEQWVSEGFQKGIHEGIKLATFKMLQAGICCSEISNLISKITDYTPSMMF